MARSAVAVLAAAALVLTACGDDDDDRTAPAPSSPTTSASDTASPDPSEPAGSPTTGAPSAPTGTRAVAVYYLGETSNGPRLYREFHRRPATTAVIRDAVQAMLTESPDDPDYTSVWPESTRLLGVALDGDLATVDLSREVRRASAGAAVESASLQQLVHTVTAAAPAVRRVQLHIAGGPSDTLWGHADTRRPMAREAQENVLGAVWLLAPTEGATVGRSFEIRGEATVFEATVSWELRRGSEVVAEGFATASTGAPERGDWKATVTADAPGTYELRAFESSAKDGRPTHVDTKRITVG